eukprot:scaffold13472_cov129-Isochrysis_galbana.AAC.4
MSDFLLPVGGKRQGALWLLAASGVAHVRAAAARRFCWDRKSVADGGRAATAPLATARRPAVLSPVWLTMEQTPADARAALSASAPNDIVMDIHSSPKGPRETAQGNMVSQSATSNASVKPESQPVTTDLLPRAPARACQSLAHHTPPLRVGVVSL